MCIHPRYDQHIYIYGVCHKKVAETLAERVFLINNLLMSTCQPMKDTVTNYSYAKGAAT